MNLLLSAIEMPKGTLFGADLYPTVYDKAAAYLYFIVKNHPFNDANKRTGFGAVNLFLKANNVEILFDDASFEKLIIAVAKGKKTKKEISYFFEHGQDT